MIGFILAAGFGTRLRPLTGHIPKAMVPVCGIPLLQRNLSFLHEQGMERIAVNTHYLPAQIYSFRKESDIPFEIFHEKGSIRGTGGALYFARSFLMSDDLFVVSNADILSNIDIQKLILSFYASDSVCMLIAAPSTGKGTILYNPDSMVYCGVPADIVSGESATGADFIGVTVYKRKVFNYITEDDFSIIPVWKRMIEQGEIVTVAVENNIYWRDTGTPAALAQIHFDVLDGSLDISLPDSVHVDYKKKIAYPATLSTERIDALGAYTWTDSDAVAPDSRIRRSIILKGARVDGGRETRDVLVTPWGDIPIE